MFAGLAALVITGWQAMSYREQVRLLQQEFAGLPPLLLLQLLAAAALAVVGGLQESGSFKPIRIADLHKPVVLRPQRIDFAAVNHRGRVFARLPSVAGIAPVPPIS
eukprot:scaffold7.g3480.t1